ncbi:unnamed protein product [Prorocentrum cordatum]|uniref:Uncharacterized protein n=1 Tax=Prorocentrum cordatum TaxID=2364126 RepID=A0ABN9SS56_9DINO|nr:unnamed protein product [Polarella glacialis]
MAARALRAGAAGGKLLHCPRRRAGRGGRGRRPAKKAGRGFSQKDPEPLRRAGGSYQGVWGSSAFVDQMAADDAFDAPLTEAGVRQAAEAGARAQELGLLLGVELAVASPLSRALDTADALLPPSGPDRGGPRRAVLEESCERSTACC